jgi:prefoldin subunit 5
VQEVSADIEEKTNELEYLNSEVRRYESVIEDLNTTVAKINT